MFTNVAATTRAKLEALPFWPHRHEAQPPPTPPAAEPGRQVLGEAHDAVYVVTLSDPATRNSLSTPLVTELMEHLDQFEGDPALKVLVLTGADPAFCSGFNVGEFAADLQDSKTSGWAPARPWEQLDPKFAGAASGHREQTGNWEVLLKLMASQKPIIAAINGPAAGLGLGMALCCDIRIASEQASFIASFVRMGIPAGDASAWTLPQLVGSGNAMLMQLTGDPINAAEAYRIGLAQRLVSHEALLPETLELAAKIAQGSSYGHALTKGLSRKAKLETFSEHFWEAQRAFALAQAAGDHEEGVRAFLEKRPPRFS
jgi:2-(1,2-epoxy-1,2-dihydrophenyl)acetyl-CoA isomerase